MLHQCWAIVYDVGPTLIQHWDETSTRCWTNVWPSYSTLAQYWLNIRSMSHVSGPLLFTECSSSDWEWFCFSTALAAAELWRVCRHRGDGDRERRIRGRHHREVDHEEAGDHQESTHASVHLLRPAGGPTTLWNQRCEWPPSEWPCNNLVVLTINYKLCLDCVIMYILICVILYVWLIQCFVFTGIWDGDPLLVITLFCVEQLLGNTMFYLYVSYFSHFNLLLIVIYTY